MGIKETITKSVKKAVKSLYDFEIDANKIPLQDTRKEFEGDFTVVVFPFVRAAKKAPEAVAEELGTYLVEKNEVLTNFNVVKGFLNLSVDDKYWIDFIHQNYKKDGFGKGASTGEKILVEFSSPNTNKPLHLGHVRNILLGWSLSQLLEYAGHEVFRTQIINDRGIAICKSMLAWKLGDQKTPNDLDLKGDQLVGQCYVNFNQLIGVEYKKWQASADAKRVFDTENKKGLSKDDFFKTYSNTYFNAYSDLGKQAKELLLKWENGEPETMKLWETMNSWVYDGFEETYEKLGVSFHANYYESKTYLLGKEMVEKGLKEKVFYKEDDNSVWIDLSDRKLDKKIVMRSDGTSVYLTQDLGTANQRFIDVVPDRMIYVVGDEQIYHFKVLFETLKKFNYPFTDGLYHLAYGMVDLPTGRMKSREGTVVDADALIEEVVAEAKKGTALRGDIGDYTLEEQEEIVRKIGVAALKYFILKFNPQRRMIFNPEESVDMQGNTGPYIQNAFVRIKSIGRRVGDMDLNLAQNYGTLKKEEKDLVLHLHNYADTIQQAANDYDPSNIAGYCYDLARRYHRFYHEVSIMRAESDEAKAFRLQLNQLVANVLESGMRILGIEMPERM